MARFGLHPGEGAVVVHSRRSQQAFTVGVHSRRPQQAFTAGFSAGFTGGVYSRLHSSSAPCAPYTHGTLVA